MSARRRPALERFALLPRAASDVWQGGLVRLPAWITPGPGTAPYRPWGALWVSRQSGLLHLKIEPAPESHGPQLLLQALLEFALDRRVGGQRPGGLEVGDDETRAWLTWALRDPELAIETVPGLAAVQEALARLDAFVHGRPPLPGALSGAGVTLARLGAFAEAARRFYAAAPWRWLTDEDLIQVESPVAPRGLGYVTVMGGAGRVYGLSFFDGPDDLEAFLEQEDVEELAGVEGRWSVLLGPITELPLADADLFREHRWPVAGPEAYPVAVRFGPGPGIQRPDAATLTYLEALLLALTDTTEGDIDRGRWERRVEAAAGPVTVALAIPALLEPLDAPPRPRRGLADRRAMERFLVEAERFVMRSGLEDAEAIHAALQERFAGRRLDELPSTAETRLERAQDVVYRAVESRGRRRVQLARHALELSPDCADAWTLLAEAAGEPGEALELYAGAVAGAERALGPEPFTADVGHFLGARRHPAVHAGAPGPGPDPGGPGPPRRGHRPLPGAAAPEPERQPGGALPAAPRAAPGGA